MRLLPLVKVPILSFAVSAGLLIACGRQTKGPTGASSPAAPPRPFAVFRVEDSVDPLADFPTSSFPAGASLLTERVPLPRGRVTVHVMSFIAGETPDATLARARAFGDKAPHPLGTFFAFEPVFAHEGTPGDASPIAYRSLLLAEPAMVDDRDIIEAKVEERIIEWPSVSIQLNDAGKERFEAGTRAWRNRRIAIALDGTVTMAPLIESAISGGRVDITAIGDTPGARKRHAERIMATLRKRTP
ncbi:MAG: hypothetical protein U0174_13810 [Polyangiaceae bacterium]